MPFSKKKIKSSNPIRWMWPLKLGLPNKIADKKNILLAGKWTNDFILMETIKKSNHYNIIFFDGSVDFQSYRPLGEATADIILVHFNHIMPPLAELGKQADELLKHFKVNGVFVLQVDDISSWFSGFSEELSHNFNVVEAIRRINIDVVCWVDPKLEKQTTLSYVIKTMITTLKTSQYIDRKFIIRNRLINQSTLSGKEVADLLKSKVNYFDSESGSATDLKEITKEVIKNSATFFRKTENSVIHKKKNHSKKSSAVKPKGSNGKANKKQGSVKFFNTEKGFGFIKHDDFDKDTFIHVSGLINEIKENDRVEFDLQEGKKVHIAVPGDGGGAAKKRAPGTKGSSLLDKIKLTDGSKYAILKKEKERLAVIEDSPRYLQANIKTIQNKTVFDFIEPNSRYNIEVFIGYKIKEALNSGEVFDTSVIFDKSKLSKETIQIKFKSNLNDSIQFKKIVFPRLGNSTPAIFSFRTDSISKKFVGDLFAYHKNRLIQHVQIIAGIWEKSVKKTDKVIIFMKPVFTARKILNDLTDSTEFASSIKYEAGQQKSSTLHGIANNKPVDLYFSDGLKEHLSDMKKEIENALIDIKNHPANLMAKGNLELLYFLALKGSLIYINHLRGVIAPGGPLQIVSNYQEYAPLEFVYSLPSPAPDAILCEHAKEALLEGKCKNCFDHKKDPAPHICPFGFWSFSRIVERHSYQKRKNTGNSDYSILSEPGVSRNTLQVLQNSIYGSSERVETSQTKGIRQQIAVGIKKNSMHLFEAAGWKDWSELVAKNKPDSIILVVHIEKDAKLKIDKIEIGNKDFLLQNYFGSNLILNKHMVTPPLIIVIGCEATNLALSGFDVAGHLMNEGAAIVLSNFTVIRGRQAKDIVIKLVGFLKQNGKSEMLFGEVMLKLRQNLLANGLMAGLSLIAQGDADWKIKT